MRSTIKCEDPKMNLGNVIILECEKRGWSLSYLARVSGVPKATLNGWTTGRKALDLDQVRRVSEALKIAFYELVFGEREAEI